MMYSEVMMTVPAHKHSAHESVSDSYLSGSSDKC